VPFSDLLDTVEITLDDRAFAQEEDERPEPTFSNAPFFVEFGEPARLDPERVGLTWELPPPPPAGMRLRASFVSLAVHLVPLLLILAWPASTTEIPLIPVQLVLEEPPPEQPPPPAPEQPKQGRISSEDLGPVQQQTQGTAPELSPPASSDAQPAAAATPTTPTVAPPAVPPPKPPPPKPAPPKPQTPAVQPPKPSAPTTARREETPREAPRAARYVGPASTRDEYLAYLVSLTRQHIDLLPMSFVGSRRGQTIVTVAVQDNGTINHISVARSSGYPDIDERIAQMVAAVRKFPPVPQWFQGSTLELELTLRFPEALQK